MGKGWQRGGVAGWQRAKAQPLATGLGYCLHASDLKSPLFSTLVNVMKKEGKKKFSQSEKTERLPHPPASFLRVRTADAGF